jgi:hypothetical protein
MNLKRVVITINNSTYETTDVPEQIGPWLGRVFDAVRPDPNSRINVEMFQFEVF